MLARVCSLCRKPVSSQVDLCSWAGYGAQEPLEAGQMLRLLCAGSLAALCVEARDRPVLCIFSDQVFTLKSHLCINAAILFCTAVSSNWILLIIMLVFNIGVFCLVIYLVF